MNSVRSDVKMIEALVEGKVLTMAEGKRYLSFPMIEVHDTNVEFRQYWVNEAKLQKASCDKGLTSADMLFTECVTAFVPETPDGSPAWLYLSFHNDSSKAPEFVAQDDALWFSYLLISHDKDDTKANCFTGAMGELVMRYENNDGNGYLARCMATMGVAYGQPVVPAKDYQDDPSWRKLEVNIGMATVKAMLFARMNLERHRYRVSVNPKNPGKKLSMSRRKLLVEACAPHVIMMNRFPDSDIEALDVARKGGGGSGGTFIGRRSAYRKTLSHPRYSKHEKYKVFKGVYVRDAWIGPEQAETQGNVYRLIDKGNEQ